MSELPEGLGTAELAARYAQAKADAAAAREDLYVSIRADLAARVRVAVICGATGLSRERIYQIRDGRR